jgi:hypothetical protein
MTELIAKPVIKNKFWIVENSGNKIATIQAIEEGGFVYVQNQARQRYPTIKLLSKEHNIVFDDVVGKKDKAALQEHSVHGYPVSNKPWNILWDVKHQFPVYTKTNKSKSFYCAGYYIIKFNNGWVKSTCPKFITLNRYEFRGPFKTKTEMQEQLRLANGK